MPLDLLASLAGANGSAAQLGSAILSQIGTANLVTKPMEKEADKLAFEYAVGAGYNPGAGAALWQRMLEKGGSVKTSGVMELFNDHPTNVSRRDTYSKTLTKWSNNVVKVDAETGMISIRGKGMVRPGRYGFYERPGTGLPSCRQPGRRLPSEQAADGLRPYTGTDALRRSPAHCRFERRAEPSCRDGPPAGPAVIGITQYLLFSRPK